MTETQIRLPVETKYKQKWHAYNLAKTNEKRMFYTLLYELCSIIPEPKYNFGRPPVPIKDLIFSLGLKLYSNYSGRKIISDLFHAKQAGYVSRTVHYNTLTDFLNSEELYGLLQKLLIISALPLKTLEDQYSLDASGFGSYQYERWMRTRFSKSYSINSRNYLKGHVCIGTRTNIIASCEVTYGNFSDVKQAPNLLKQVKGRFNVKEVSADKGYDSNKLVQIIEEMGAIPYILFKDNRNPDPRKSPEIIVKMHRYFKNNKEEYLKKYHRRSNVETTFSMIKLRLGEFLKCKNYTSQRNELVMKFICHNICCLIQEIFESDININFKNELLTISDRKVGDSFFEEDF